MCAAVYSALCLANLTPHYSSDLTLAQPMAPGVATGTLHTQSHTLGQQLQLARPPANFTRADIPFLNLHVHNSKYNYCHVVNLPMFTPESQAGPSKLDLVEQTSSVK